MSRVGRFLVLDTGLSAPDRAKLLQHYRFLEFTDSIPCDTPAAQLAQLHLQINGRFWLHLGEGWRFFSPENYITRLTAVLDAEPHVFQVGINFTDAAKLTGTTAAEQTIRRTPDAGRYLLTDAMATGPAMFHTARLERAVSAHDNNPHRPPNSASHQPPSTPAAHRQPRRSALHLRSAAIVTPTQNRLGRVARIPAAAREWGSR